MPFSDTVDGHAHWLIMYWNTPFAFEWALFTQKSKLMNYIHYSFFHVSCFEKIYEKSKWQRFCSSLLIRNELKKKHSLFGQWFVILWTLSLVWLKVDSNDLCSCMNLVHMFLEMYTYKCRGIYCYILNYLESNWTPPVSDQYWLLLVVPLF